VRHPLARTENLLVEEFGDELLIYDQRSDQAHCLTSAATRVRGACDGSTPVERLGPALRLDEATVARALEELDACGLLDSGPATGVTRREATAKLARIGAAVVSAPLIYSIAAPAPAMAASAAFCASLACPANAAACASAGCILCQGNACVSGQRSGKACVATCASCTTTLVNNNLACIGRANSCNTVTCPG